MAKPGKPSGAMGDPNAHDVIKFSTDELSEHYAAVAEDGSKGAANREAAMFFTIAEQHLEDSDDFEECLKSVGEALKLFRSAGDSKGEADALRLTIHAYRSKADSLGCRVVADERKQRIEVLDEAEELAKSQANAFKASGDTRGEAAMRLSFAEVNMMDWRGVNKRNEAVEAVYDAKRLIKEVGDVKLEAAIATMTVGIYTRSKAREDARNAAEEALALYRQSDNQKGLAKAWHMVGYTRVLADEFEDGVQAAMQALQLFRELGLTRFEAFENFAIAQYFLVRSKALSALPHAFDALSIFREVQYGCWTAHAYDQVVECHIACGQRREALRVAAEGVAEIVALKDKRSEALALRTLSFAHFSAEEFKEALSAAEEALYACEGMRDGRWEATMHNEVANIHLAMGNAKSAERSVEDGISLMQTLHDAEGEAVLLNTLLQVQLAMNNTEAAMQTVNEQKALFQRLEDRSREAATLMSLASCLSLEGKIDEAFDMLHEAREIGNDAGDKRIVARSWSMVAELNAAQGQLEKALSAAEEMRACLKSTGDQAEEAKALALLCNIHLQRDNPHEAVKLANDAQLIAKRAGDRKMQVSMWTLQANAQVALLSQGDEAAMQKNRNRALKPAQEAVSLAKKLGDQELIGTTQYTMGMVQMMTGKVGEAMSLLSEARSIFFKSGNKSWETRVVLMIAQTQAAKGNEERAREVANQALEMAQSSGDAGQAAEAMSLIDRYTPKQQQPQGQWIMAPTGTQAAQPVADGDNAIGQFESAVVAAPKEKGLDRAMVMAQVTEVAKNIVGGDDELSSDTALMDAGMDSLSALSFRQSLSQQVGLKLPSSFVFDYPSLREVTDRIVEMSKEDA